MSDVSVCVGGTIMGSRHNQHFLQVFPCVQNELSAHQLQDCVHHQQKKGLDFLWKVGLYILYKQGALHWCTTQYVSVTEYAKIKLKCLCQGCIKLGEWVHELLCSCSDAQPWGNVGHNITVPGHREIQGCTNSSPLSWWSIVCYGDIKYVPPYIVLPSPGQSILWFLKGIHSVWSYYLNYEIMYKYSSSCVCYSRTYERLRCSEP